MFFGGLDELSEFASDGPTLFVGSVKIHERTAHPEASELHLKILRPYLLEPLWKQSCFHRSTSSDKLPAARELCRVNEYKCDAT